MKVNKAVKAISIVALVGLIGGILIVVSNKWLIQFFVARIDRTPAQVSPSENLEILRSVPYLSYVVGEQAGQKVGVVKYERDLCSKGVNIYNCNSLPGAYLLDMSGDIFHTWKVEGWHWGWHSAKMDEKGDLLVIIKDIMLMKLDWNSNIKWTTRLRFHHDIVIGGKGDIYTLTRDPRWIYHKGEPIMFLDDYLVILSPDGKLKRQISFFDLLRKEVPDEELDAILLHLTRPPRIPGAAELVPADENLLRGSTRYDILHVNSLQIIAQDFPPLFKKGNILFCAKMLDLVGVMDLEQEKLTWSWGGNYLDEPHHPTLLENGNILIFDNGTSRKYSRVLELDPSTKEIVWKYEGLPREAFFSSWGGACQRLPNGNTLITDSSQGRIFEITRDGEIVWDFYNPLKARNGKRATIYRMSRIVDVENYPILRTPE